MERKERPIIFQAESVKAILEGRKTQTRWVIKPQPQGVVNFAADSATAYFDGNYKVCPFGVVGDLLWCRENWAYSGCVNQSNGKNFAYVGYQDGTKRNVPFDSFDEMMAATPEQRLKYPADWDEMDADDQIWWKSEALHKWWDRQKNKPARYMPRWASRLTLEITNIRVKKLNDISGGDVWREGIGKKFQGDCDFDYEFWTSNQKTAFAEAWDQINPKNPWLSDPWVWVIEFKPNGR